MYKLKNYKLLIYLLVVLSGGVLLLISCGETEQQRKVRLQQEEQQQIESAQKTEQERMARLQREEQQRTEQEKRAEEEQIAREEEHKAQEIYDKYINNSLQTGSTPYSKYYGENSSCNDYGCSKIRVRTPYNSDVLVTIKLNNSVVRHAYIQAGDSYTFSMPNGTYQPFFYYGKGWNPEKVMKETSQISLKGGFVTNEDFGKDDPQYLENQILEYELILQSDGNFSTRPSNAEEAL
jgi:hypothetical protein